jgi:hypothetical protein
MNILIRSNINNKYDIADIAFFSSLILILIPVWIFEYPAMVDLPQHVAQVKALESLLDGNSFYSDIYQINWFTPYILPNLILLLFSKLSTPLISVKIVVSLYLISIPLISRKLLTFYNRPKELQLLAIPFLYSAPFNWGFIPYLLSISIGAMWIYYFLNKNNNPLSIINIILSFLLSYSHAIAWGLTTFNILIIFIYNQSFKYSYKNIFKETLKILPILSPLFLILFWSYLSVNNESSAMELRAIGYYPIMYKILIMFVANFMGNDILIGIPKLVIFYFLIRTLTKIDKATPLPLILTLSNMVLFYLSPSILFSTAYFSDRLLVLLPILFTLTIKELERKTLFIFLSILCVILSVSSRVTKQYIVEEDNNDFSIVTSHIKNKSNIFYISDKNDLGKYKYGIQNITYFIHTAQLLNNNFDVAIDFNFAYYHNMMVRYIKKSQFNSQISYNYKNLDWSKIGKAKYEYIIVRDCDITNHIITKIENNANQKLIAKKNCWTVYERNK